VSLAPDWTEEAATDRWLADLERDATLAGVVRTRLGQAPVTSGDRREEAYRSRAAAWLERGHPEVALRLLERGVGGFGECETGGPSGRFAPGGLAGQLELFIAGRPGSAGLPALTGTELEKLRQESDPEQALKIIRSASRRLQAHGIEARALLRRYIERKRAD
jgi:hypothetical protein